MGTGVRQAGFTVIEVMLFLAVSATLAAAIFATTMLNINTQRYTDSVRSFKALVQEQYINTTRVQNPNDITSHCPDVGMSEQDRGTNDCLVVGKLFSVTGGKNIVIRSVVGVPPDEEKYTGTDIQALQAMKSLFAVNAGAETLSPAWDTSLLAKLPAAPLGVDTFSIAIVRSPSTGTPYTFFIPGKAYVPLDSSSIGEDIKLDVIGTSPVPPANLLSQDLAICVDPQGLTSTGQQQITIRSKNAGPSGIEQGDRIGC